MADVFLRGEGGLGAAAPLALPRGRVAFVRQKPGPQPGDAAPENAFAGQGWQLVLAEGTKLTRDLVKREGRHDLAPSWRPRGGEVAYLAQVGVVR